MESGRKTRVLILGGGFAGLTVAMELERTLGRDRSFEITLVNRENFFLFTPMLHEVAASDLDLTTIVNPSRKMLQRVQFFVGEVDRTDLEKRHVSVSHRFDHHQQHPPSHRESGFAPRWYVPRADIDESALTFVEHQAFCSYKGLCSYNDIGDARLAAWSYREAYAEVRRISALDGNSWVLQERGYRNA